VIRGASEEPVYIVIDDNYVDIRSAKDLWGLDVIESSARVQEVLGKGYKVLTIGKAG